MFVTNVISIIDAIRKKKKDEEKYTSMSDGQKCEFK